MRTSPPSPPCLRTLPAAPGSVRLSRPAAPAGVLKVGEGAYSQNCAACQQVRGQGVAGGFPALAHNPVVNAGDPTSLIHLVLTGGAIPKTSKTGARLVMPPFASTLSNQNIADVLTYIRSAWGNHAAPVSPPAVKALRASLKAPEPSAPSGG